MKEQELKEACRLFWIVKGHLNTSSSTVLSSYNGYFKRCWGNDECYVHEDGFEEAWNNFKESLNGFEIEDR